MIHTPLTDEMKGLADEIARSVVRAVRRELKLSKVKLLTIPECAALYRKRKETITLAVESGDVKSTKNERGHYMISAEDAEREWGAQ